MTASRSKKLSADDIKLVSNLITEHQDDLKAYIHRKVGDLDLTEEIFQETYLLTLVNFHTLEDRDHFRSWLFVIASNVCTHAKKRIESDQIKCDRYSKKYKVQIQNLYQNISPLEKMIRDEKLQLILDAVDSMPDDYQSVYYGFHFAHKTISELAAEHQITQRSIKARLAKAREIIRFKTKDYVIVGLTLRLLQSGSQGAWNQTYAQFNTTPLNISSDMIEAAPIVMDTVTEQTSQVMETTVKETGAVSTVVGMIPSAFFAAAMPFLWLISVLMGSQTFGLALVHNASKMPIRRWFVKQLFICYCGMMIIPMYFLCLHKSLLSLMLGWDSKYYLPVLLGCIIFIPAVVYLRRLHSSYQKLLNNDSSSLTVHELTFSRLSRTIHCGFGWITILLVVFFGLFLLWVAFPNYDVCLKAKQWEQCRFIIFYSVAIFLVFSYFHTSNFFLFRYFLAISKDDHAMPPPVLAHESQRRLLSFAMLWELAYTALFVVLTLAPALLHLCLKNTRPVWSIAELVGFSFCWFGVLSSNTKNPGYRWQLILTTFFILVVILAILRLIIYEP